MIGTIRLGLLALAIALSNACTTSTRYHDALVATLSDAERTRCQESARAASARVHTYSLTDLGAEGWARAMFGALPIYVVEIGRFNDTQRHRAREDALRECITSRIENQ